MSVKTIFFLLHCVHYVIATDVDDDFYYSCHDQFPDCTKWTSEGACFPKVDVYHGEDAEYPEQSRWYHVGIAQNTSIYKLKICGSNVLSVRGVYLLSHCRQSCKTYYDAHFDSLTELQERFLGEMGGLADEVRDMFGNAMPVCDLK